MLGVGGDSEQNPVGVEGEVEGRGKKIGNLLSPVQERTLSCIGFILCLTSIGQSSFQEHASST